MKFYLSLFFLCLIGLGHAQINEIGLSQAQREKINKVESGEKKLILYRKYLHKDSIRYFKEVDHFWKKKSDSVTARMTSVTQKVKNKKEKLLLKTKVEDPNLQKVANAAKAPLHQQLNGKYKIPDLSSIPGLDKVKKPSLGLDKINEPAKGIEGKVKGLVQENVSNNALIKEGTELKGQVGEYLGDVKKYGQYADMSPDSLKQLGLGVLQENIQDRIIPGGIGQFQQQLKQVNDLKAMPNKYKSEMEGLQDSTRRKEMAKAKAEEMAMEYLAQNPGIMQAAQRKMQLLMKKYSYVSNSNDLSTAVKRTSLKGKTFRERLVVAANLQVLSIDPVVIDFSPQLGYKFNSRFVMGVGGTYRQTFKDSIPTVSPEVFGFKGFVSYDVVKSFFAYGEYAQNSPGVKVLDGNSHRIWNNACLLGVGRKLSLHKKVDMTIVALYNVLHKPGDPIYPKPFMIRIGFQLSDIALLKKKPELKY